MARPGHPGVLYFPLDCHMDDDVKLIQAEYGLTGFAVVVKLYQKIYGGLGYYCEWNEDVGLLFAQHNNVGYNLVSEIVGACLRRGIFSEELFRRFGILTSHGIQKRYLKMVERRVGEKISREYALVECAQKGNMNTETPENVAETPQNVAETSVEKEKEIKENNTLSLRTCARGKNQNVILSDEEYEDLCQRIPVADAYIDYFSDKLLKKGYQYESHHDAILDWWNKDAARFERKVKNQKTAPAPKDQEGHTPLGKSFDVDDLFHAALNRGFQMRRED